MNHVVGFSGGAASAVVAKIVRDAYPESTVLLFCDTRTEPGDNDRFREDVARFLGLPITRLADGRDIWELFRDERFLGNQRLTPCSEHLKVQVGERWMREHMPCTYYVGYTPDEWRRAQRLTARKAAQGVPVKFPLIEQGISKEECLRRVEKCWGLRLPEMYAWAEHANCVPCVKGGLAYWGMLYRRHPEAWARAAEAERETGEQILKATRYGTLEEELDHCLRLADQYMRDRAAGARQMQLFETPCECAA